MLLVITRIKKELDKLKSPVLFWFASGDCPPKHTGRVLKLMKSLSDFGVVQQGFTRNRDLWDKVRDIPNNFLVLTTESLKEAEMLSKKGVVAVPDYRDGRIALYRNERHYGGCGADWFEFDEVCREADCLACYQQNMGCYTDARL